MKKIMSLSSGPPAEETHQTSILTRMTKTVKYHIRQSFPYSVALFIVNGSPADIAFYARQFCSCTPVHKYVLAIAYVVV